MTRNRARKIDTRRNAADNGLTYAQAAQVLAAQVKRRPEIPEGGFVLDLWDGSEDDEATYPEPRCMGCFCDLPIGVPNVVLPEVLRVPGGGSPYGLCRRCLPDLRERLQEAERILAAQVKRRPEIPEGGFVLDLWDGSEDDEATYPEPRCMGCFLPDLLVGVPNVVLPEVLRVPGGRSPYGLCRRCLPDLRERLQEAERILADN
ncbi:hypothetical protein AB0C76_32975 [Kitasatospora sp. NPDC048722]|uniref:hypothetical protein n=1 Tax=Kitasatospora sp. NPDC048722 TaxID=3155639 RepID=UPI0033DED6A3